ncbi:hypothetical protein Pelo_19830 [Pelomyxa schiedti]|nr:hypothetical protein Pelo_19830 [Pelomyxa schiedti]
MSLPSCGNLDGPGSSVQVAREKLATHAFNVFEQAKEFPDLFEQVFEQTAVLLLQLPQLNFIDEGKLRKFGRYIHGGYKDNPYHNSLHAIDVMQSVHYLLNLPCFLGCDSRLQTSWQEH